MKRCNVCPDRHQSSCCWLWKRCCQLNFSKRFRCFAKDTKLLFSWSYLGTIRNLFWNKNVFTYQMNKAAARSYYNRHIPTHTSKAEEQTETFVFSGLWLLTCMRVCDLHSKYPDTFTFHLKWLFCPSLHSRFWSFARVNVVSVVDILCSVIQFGWRSLSSCRNILYSRIPHRTHQRVPLTVPLTLSQFPSSQRASVRQGSVLASVGSVCQVSCSSAIGVRVWVCACALVYTNGCFEY